MDARHTTIFDGIRRAADNGRFGASGAVTRPTLECRTVTSALVQTAVKAPPAPSRWDVKRKRGRQCSGTIEQNVNTVRKRVTCTEAR